MKAPTLSPLSSRAGFKSQPALTLSRPPATFISAQVLGRCARSARRCSYRGLGGAQCPHEAAMIDDFKNQNIRSSNAAGRRRKYHADAQDFIVDRYREQRHQVACHHPATTRRASQGHARRAYRRRDVVFDERPANFPLNASARQKILSCRRRC